MLRADRFRMRITNPLPELPNRPRQPNVHSLAAVGADGSMDDGSLAVHIYFVRRYRLGTSGAEVTGIWTGFALNI